MRGYKIVVFVVGTNVFVISVEIIDMVFADRIDVLPSRDMDAAHLSVSGPPINDQEETIEIGGIRGVGGHYLANLRENDR